MFKILERFERGAGDDRGKGETDDAGEESLEVVGNGIGAGKLEDLYRGLIGEGEGEDENDQDDEEDEEEREELVRRLEGVDLGKYPLQFQIKIPGICAKPQTGHSRLCTM